MSEIGSVAGRRPYYGWAVVAVATVVAFCSGPGQSYVFSVFLDSIIEATGFSRTQVSALYAVGTGLSALLVVFVSRLADRRGPRVMLIVVAAGLGLACFGMSVASGPIAIFLAFASLRALGQGSLPVNGTLLVANWFVRYRGRAMAIIGLGFAASNALIPPISRLLIEEIGWRGAYAALGVMVWLLAIPMSAPSLIVTALVFHQVSIFEEQGLSASVAAAVFVPYAIASAGMSLVSGYLIDRIGPRWLFVGNLVMLLLAMIVLQFVSSSAGAIVYALVLGMVGGMQSIVSGVTWAYYYGRHGLGQVQGSAMMVSITGAALGPLPLAVLYGLTGNYTLGINVMIALLLGCIAVAVFFAPNREEMQAA